VAINRAKAYAIIRDLLPPEPVSVIEFGCRDGRGRTYLGERVRYLGLERSRMTRPWPGVDVRAGFDYLERVDIPAGFDVGICLAIGRDWDAGSVVWRLAKAVRPGGQVFVGLRGFGDVEKVRKFFREVKVWQASDVLLVECRGLKTAKEIAA
jgi:hypothetical protein